MMKETSPSVMNMKVITYCDCWLWLLVALLTTAIITYARRAGMPPLCVGKMWTDVQKHIIGDKI